MLKDLAIPPAELFVSNLAKINDRKLVFLESFGESRIRYYYGHSNLEEDDQESLNDSMSIINIPVT